VIINDLVCEACGDCSVQSNCVAVQPVETEFGRKRQIDQSSCNKDFSCVKGFCPSFVTVHGAKVRKAAPETVSTDGMTFSPLPDPAIPAIDRTFNIIVTGVGGTGVVTIGAILGMAAHLEGKGLGMIDMAGLAQKGGAVYSHVRLANAQEDIHAIRVTAGAAHLILGCDLVVTGNKKVLASVKRGQTALVVNTAEVMPGDFTRNADFSLPVERIKRAIVAAGGDAVAFTDATATATALLGNAIAANMFMLGYAYQLGRVPLSGAAIEKAIELNGEAVRMNLEAFAWGRRAAAEPDTVARLVGELHAPVPSRKLSETLDEVIARRVEFLGEYQSARYARRYRAMVERVKTAEAGVAPGSAALTDAVARSLFKLMAYKDEYEVARLYTNGHFERQIATTFQGENLRYEFHLAPPLLARKDGTGVPKKMSFGPWMMKAFRVLARFRRLRGTPLDLFGYTHERRTERRLIRDFERLLREILENLTPENHAIAVGLASIPQKIRGFGHIKARNLKAAKAEEAELLARFRSPESAQALPAAAE
jgi:indolepyruvate ferredoxin oxidoreductase